MIAHICVMILMVCDLFLVLLLVNTIQDLRYKAWNLIAIKSCIVLKPLV